MHGLGKLQSCPFAGIYRVALVCLLALFGSSLFAVELPPASADGAIRIQGPGVSPKLFFACCDQGIADLESWVSNPKVISELQGLHAGLAVEISDFTDTRAQAVRKLDEAGIPLTAWIVLSKEQGHYLNSDNAAQAAERFAQFEEWTRANDLRWAGVGLDIEPNFQQLHALGDHKWQLITLMVRRYFDEGQVQRAREEYAALIGQIQAAGFPVQTYQMNFLANERSAHTTLLERLLGLVDVCGGEEVLMVYSTMNRAAGPAIVLAYAGKGETVAVGSTLGGGQPGVGYGPLDWEEFSRDLIVASHFSSGVGIYSLEGCMRQGFLPRLSSFDWSQTVAIPAASVTRMRRMQEHIGVILWTASRLPYLLGSLVLLVVGFLIWIRWQSRNRVKAGA